MVFGAAGAVGSDLVGRLAAQQGARVIASDRDHSDLDELSKAVKDATIVPADTQDPDAVRTSSLTIALALQSPDAGMMDLQSHQQRSQYNCCTPESLQCSNPKRMSLINPAVKHGCWEQVASVISKAADQHGRVDGVASCVGSMLIKPAHLTSTDEFVEQMRENALSAFHILKGSVRF